MKLASYKDGSRDGQLVVVSRDLSRAVHANGIASRLQAVLDDWNFLAPQLQDLSQMLNHGKERHAFPFEPAMCLAPLPRAPRWVRASAALAGCAATLHEQAADFGLGARQDVVVSRLDPAMAGGGLRLRTCHAVVTGDIGAGMTAAAALEGVRLLGLLGDWAWSDAAADGTDAEHALAPSWAPVLVTLDEVAEAWQRGRLKLRVDLRRQGQPIALREAADSIASPAFGELLARLARQRPLHAGTVLSVPVSGAAGAAAAAGTSVVPWVDGDGFGVEAIDALGQSVFGAIDGHLVSAAAD